MNLFGLMETSGSAMQAERMRAEVVAANMANAGDHAHSERRSLSPPARGLRGQSGCFELEWRRDR
jgi:flagellar basal body rod protein FlgC